jgi:hypothetical protein
MALNRLGQYRAFATVDAIGDDQGHGRHRLEIAIRIDQANGAAVKETDFYVR